MLEAVPSTRVENCEPISLASSGRDLPPRKLRLALPSRSVPTADELLIERRSVAVERNARSGRIPPA